MKLREIKQPRVGQVWEAHHNLYVVETCEQYITTQVCIAMVSMYERGRFDCKGVKEAPDFFVGKRLIGKIGITHKINGFFISEIEKSAGLHVDDVVKFNTPDRRLYVINREIDFGIKEKFPDNTCFEATNDTYGSRELVDFELKKVGILGITHEFVNDKEPGK